MRTAMRHRDPGTGPGVGAASRLPCRPATGSGRLMRLIAITLAVCALTTTAPAAPPATPPSTASSSTAPPSGTPPAAASRPTAEAASVTASPTPPIAIGLRLASGERALPTRVYARDATVTLYDSELEEPAGSSGSILRVGLDVYLDADGKTYSGHALVPLGASARVGRKSALPWRRDLARFHFPGADPLHRAALTTAARFAFARQPELLYADHTASVATSTARWATVPRGSRGLGLAEPLVPLEQTRLRERLRREALRGGHERLTADPRVASPAVVPGSGYFQRARRLGPVIGLPGGPQRAGFGRR